MYRHHSPRYQGAKGLKVKHVLQIAILTVILTWVVYELSRIQKSSPSDGQDRSSLQATIPEPLSGRKVLKPRDKPGKLDWELEIDDTTTKSSSEGAASCSSPDHQVLRDSFISLSLRPSFLVRL